MRAQELHSYVPIEEFYNEKDHIPCHLLYGDCAVVYAADDWHTLAQSRADGRDAPISSFFEQLNEQEQIELSALLLKESEEPLFIPHRGGTLLLFGEWYAATRLVPAVWIDTQCESLKQQYVLQKMPTKGEYLYASDADADDMREARMRTLFAHMSRLFGKCVPTNVVTLLLSVASFAGCRLHGILLPSRDVYLKESEAKNLCAYLLCVFLSRRRYSGEIDVTANHGGHKETEEGLLIERMSVAGEYDLFIKQQPSAYTRRAPRSTLEKDRFFDLHALPCFCNYSAEENDGELNLCISIHQSNHLSATFLSAAANVLSIRLLPREMSG